MGVCIQHLEGQAVSRDQVCAQFHLQDGDSAIDISEFLAVLRSDRRYTDLMQMFQSHNQRQASSNAKEETHRLTERSSMQSVNGMSGSMMDNSLAAKGVVSPC